MDRAEAIMMLNVIATNLVGELASEKDDKRAENAMRLINAVDMAIAALREQEQSKWISVNKRLPEKDCEHILVCYSDGWICDQYTPVDNGVTHWMPLPEPPKEGAEG